MFVEEQNRNKPGTLSPSKDEDLIPAAITDTGCERELNEDRYAVIEAPAGVAWLVCDGMGGATGGELAAQLAIDAIKRDLDKHGGLSVEVALKNAIIEANRVIVLRRQNQAFASMGTTIVGVMFDGQEMAVANIGDSRAYVVRAGMIQALTVDHTYVQQLVDRGEIRPEEALSHPQAHILTRCVGAEPGIEVDVKKFWIWSSIDGAPPDRIVLCSDGLYSLVSESEIAQSVTHNSPQVACVKLVELAKARGGYDNITVSIVPLAGEVRSDPPPIQETARKPVESGRTVEERPHRSIRKHIFGMAALSFVVSLIAVVFFVVTRVF
jgi:serine/threonine protein phosphatase PrpC